MEESKNKIKKLVAEYVGVEVSELEDNDSFTQDLHMSATDIADFSHKLAEEGYPNELDFTKITTIQELIDAISSETEL